MADNNITTFENFVKEGTTSKIVATLLDQDDVPVPGDQLTALKLTLYEQKSKAIINNRNDQNVLQQNDVTVDENGILTFKMRVQDNVIVNPRRDVPNEVHVAMFTYGWNDGDFGGVGKHECLITVVNAFGV